MTLGWVFICWVFILVKGLAWLSDSFGFGLGFFTWLRFLHGLLMLLALGWVSFFFRVQLGLVIFIV